MQTRQTPYLLSRVPTPNIISPTVRVGLRVTSATRKVAQLQKQQGRRTGKQRGKMEKKGGGDEGRAAEKQKVWLWLGLFV